MKISIVPILMFLTLSAYAQDFQPEGNRLSLAFVVDDELFLLVMQDQGVLSLEPKGLQSPTGYENIRTMEFHDDGLLRFSSPSGRMRQYLYSQVEEDQVLFARELGTYLLRNPDRQWYRAIAASGESLYFRFYYDSVGALHVHTIQFVRDSTLRSSVYRAVGIERF